MGIMDDIHVLYSRIEQPAVDYRQFHEEATAEAALAKWGLLASITINPVTGPDPVAKLEAVVEVRADRVTAVATAGADRVRAVATAGADRVRAAATAGADLVGGIARAATAVELSPSLTTASFGAGAVRPANSRPSDAPGRAMRVAPINEKFTSLAIRARSAGEQSKAAYFRLPEAPAGNGSSPTSLNSILHRIKNQATQSVVGGAAGPTSGAMPSIFQQLRKA